MLLTQDFTNLKASIIQADSGSRSPQELGKEFAERVLDNWFDEGHSMERERMDREYAVSALEGQIEGYWPRWDRPDDEVAREIMQAGLDHLGDIIAPEVEREVRPKRRRDR